MTIALRATAALAVMLFAPLSPVQAQRSSSRLPPVPPVHGPLHLVVAYPAGGSRVDARDSIFLFGTAGDGDARVWLDGQPASVAPNGAWLAWIAIPADSSFVVHIVARRGADTTALALPLAHAGWVRETGAWVDRESMSPSGDVRWPGSSALALTVRAAPGSRVRLMVPAKPPIEFIADSIAEPIAEGIRDFDHDDRNLRRSFRADWYVAAVPPSTASVTRDLFTPIRAGPVPQLEVIHGRDTSRTPWPVALHRVVRPPQAVTLNGDPEGRGAAESTTIGRAFPAGTYTWFLPQGTRTFADMRIGEQVRLRLAHDAVAWVPFADVHPLPAAGADRPSVMGSLTLTAAADRSQLRLPLSAPVAVSADEGDESLTLTLYGAVSNANWTRYGAGQTFIQSVAWTQVAEDRVTVAIRFDRPLWGWKVRVDGTDLVVDFRQPPTIDPAHPLAGRRIVIDAGHPPGGACGPTGLCEPEANLAVAGLVRDALDSAGAVVTMTRTNAGSVGLWPRVALADSLDADLLVSIHNNAFPDDVNPFTNSGSTTFFNHLPSIGLARAIQQRLVGSLGLRDLGVARGDLALVRSTWYPSVLVEGLFLMFPDQEAALRTRAGQELYASAVVAGITDFLRRRTPVAPRN